MKNFFIAFISFLFIFTIGCETSPKRQFVFFNDSDRELNIVFEKDSVYEFDKKIPARSNAFGVIPLGKYNIITYDKRFSNKKYNLFDSLIYRAKSPVVFLFCHGCSNDWSGGSW